MRRSFREDSKRGAERNRLGRLLLGVLMGPLWVAALLATGDDLTRMVFVGDTGSGSDRQKRVAERIEELADRPGLDGVVLLGDNIYGRNKSKLFQKRFLEVYSRLFSRGVPLHAALGNHDVERCQIDDGEPLPRGSSAYLDGASCWAHEQIAIPEFGYRDGHRYYSFTTGGDPPVVETFVLDSNTLLAEVGGGSAGAGPDQAQLDWLESALAKSKARWKILAMHHPIHSPKGKRAFGLGHEAETGLRARLEEIIVGRIDVVFQGHNHLYARMLPRRGVRYFVSGAGGKKPYRFVPDADTVARPDDDGRFNHFVFLEANGQRLKYCVKDSGGEIRDAGWFAKGDAADSPLPPASCP